MIRDAQVAKARTMNVASKDNMSYYRNPEYGIINYTGGAGFIHEREDSVRREPTPFISTSMIDEDYSVIDSHVDNSTRQ